MRRSNRRRRGFGLLEMMIASVVLAVGFLASYGMLRRVQDANRSLDFARTTQDLFSRLSAELRDAQCDYDGSQLTPAIDEETTDPGLLVNDVWIDLPIDDSSIRTVGQTQTDAIAPTSIPRTIAPMLVSYRVLPEAPPTLLGGGALPAGDPGPAFDIDVRIRLITSDPARDSAERGWWIKDYALKKVCNPRYGRVGLGSGRGEFL